MADILLTIPFVSIGAVFGAETRFWVTGKLRHLKPLPYGTLFVNITGSFGLGFFVVVASLISLQAQLASLIGTGFFGCYTTMSSFAVETLTLNEESKRLAFMNIVLMITFVLLGAILGKSILLLFS